MATEKTLKTRVVLKHDTEANWITAGNAANPFIPKKGEVIIYDPDGTHTYSRQKVGDGIKNINALPFLGATVGTADSSESLSKIQYTAESAIPTTPEQGVEYAITDAIGYGDLDSELQAKVDAGANAGSNLSNYLPLSGGTMTGDLKVNSGVYVKNDFYVCRDAVGPTPVGGMIYTECDSSGPIFRVRKADTGVSLSAENGGTIEFGVGMVTSRFTGISDSKGTSSSIAVSQKCLNDNYIPFDNIPTLKRHLDIPIGTYSVIFTNSTGNGNSVSINGNRIDVSDNTNEQTLTINQSNISYVNSNGESWTFAGISDSKGTSSTIAASQKCLSTNYVAKTDLPSNLLKYQVVTSTSQIGTDTNTAYLILE